MFVNSISSLFSPLISSLLTERKWKAIIAAVRVQVSDLQIWISETTAFLLSIRRTNQYWWDTYDQDHRRIMITLLLEIRAVRSSAEAAFLADRHYQVWRIWRKMFWLWTEFWLIQTRFQKARENSVRRLTLIHRRIPELIFTRRSFVCHGRILELAATAINARSISVLLFYFLSSKFHLVGIKLKSALATLCF